MTHEALLADLPALLPALEATYVDLHAHPELSFAETRTAGLLADALEGFGYAVQRGVGGTGVVAVLANGPGPVVALRADTDALPLTEATGLPYSSRVPGVMHACGHDLHVTWLLGAAQLLATHRDAWAGTLVLLGQPAEEIGAGARAMLDGGLAGLIPHPDVVLGQHVTPAPSGWVLHRAGPAMAAADSLTVTLHGRGGHGSRPETTVDPILLAAHTVVRLQGIVAREVAPFETAVVTVGALHAGTVGNIIPASAELKLNLRSYTPAIRAQLLAAVERIVGAEAEAAGAPTKPDIERTGGFPVLVNDPDATARTRAAHTAALGAGRVIEAPVVMGSEDFGVLGEELGSPSVFWFVGGGDPEKVLAAIAADRFDTDIASNHSPHFAPVLHPSLAAGVETLVVAALAWLDPR